ncbi:EamA/RhaT family transporter, partial [Campylobacter coli]|nr:EamA/RhaT family transporter [Campylobacter coli]EAK4492224.1 EamA/RhaT family transporter [Campylobacter coli]
DEVPTILTLIGCVLAIFAIYFINIYGKKKS